VGVVSSDGDQLMNKYFLDRRRIWAAVLFVSILVSGGNYFLKLGLFGRYGVGVLIVVLFVSFVSLVFILPSTDQMGERGDTDIDRGWLSVRQGVRRALASLLGDSDFRKMVVCLGLGLGLGEALMQWAPNAAVVAFVPSFLLLAAGLFFCMRGFWRMRS
jgi:hypothetical protein